MPTSSAMAVAAVEIMKLSWYASINVWLDQSFWYHFRLNPTGGKLM